MRSYLNLKSFISISLCTLLVVAASLWFQTLAVAEDIPVGQVVEITEITSGLKPSHLAFSGNFITYKNLYSDDELYLYDLALGTETLLLSGGNKYVYPPDISGNLILYSIYDYGTATNQLRLYDLVTGNDTYVGPGAANHKISGTRVVFMGAGYTVTVLDLETGDTIQVTNNSNTKSGADISGNLVVWSEVRYGNSDIFIYDLATGVEQQLTTDSKYQMRPAIDGNRVVWTDGRHNYEAEVYLYDLALGVEVRVAPGKKIRGEIDVSGDIVTYITEELGPIYQLFMYNISTEETVQITDATERINYGNPVVDNNRIIWTGPDPDTGKEYIYMYVVPDPPIVDAGPDQNLFVDGEISLAGSATDPNGHDIVSWQWAIESAPAGSSPFISNLFTPGPVFRTDIIGDYVLSLIACNALLCSEPDTVTIHVTDYQVHEISQEVGYYPMINDRRDCIWIGANDGLYFYDAFTGETKLLAAAATIFSDYEINNNGDVGWYAPWRSTVEDAEVYVYDHSSRTTVQVTNNDVEDVFYKITDNGTVYFVSKQADGTYILNTYDIDTGVTTTVADLNQFAQWPEAINANGDVLWRVRSLYLYSAATGTTVPISPLDISAFEPSMNDRGDVSYRLFASDYHAIMFYDASTGQVKELTRGDPNSVWEPKTSNNGNVVWTGSDTAFDIFYYDYALDSVEQLTFLTDDFWYGFWDKNINDFGDSVWIDWTPRTNTRTELNIYLHEEGRIEVINSVTNPEWPQINSNADAVFEGDNSQPWGRGVYLATRAATVDEVVNTIDELTTTGSLDTATAEELQTSFDEAMEALSAGDETEAEKKIFKFEADIDKAEKKGELDADNAKKLEDALKEVVSSY